jgi:WD40 repeat protein/class 3 adenylate cyclase/transcriptional regulator with XRE-family HTH domain
VLAVTAQAGGRQRGGRDSGLPGGAVTFVFTDIEGSTRLVKALRDRYAQVLADHQQLIRAAIAAQGGYEVDTQGDAFFVAFAGAKQAVLCALAIQRALAGHDWPAEGRVRVRIGIHTGQAVPAGGRYTGLAVHRAARIGAAARGGQVLISQATQSIIEDEEEEDPGFTLVDLGEQKLKDLDRPVRLYQLAAPGLDPPVRLAFAGLLRQLRAEAGLTQEELAEAAGLSPRLVSDLERGIHRTARKDTALMLANALGLAETVCELFVAAARGRGPAEAVLAAPEDGTPDLGHLVAQRAPWCPYRGLLAFGESDAEVFYGRERLAAELAAKVAARSASGGMVVVTGASGSGKSSLLRAGLLPILARGQQVRGSDRWPRIVMTPAKDPLAELAACLAAVGGPDALAVRDGLARHPGQAHLAIRSAVLAAADRRDEQPPGSGDSAARLVLIVDQFEQVFTLNPDRGGEATRQAFITALCSAAANPVGGGQEPPAVVVIAVRGDFWDRCAAVPELVGELQEGQFVVGPMTESELRVAITGPAEAAGLRIDPALTDTILGDLRVAGGDHSAGVLPLLSQAMALTWEHREGDRLTSHGYAKAGGVSNAVQTGADTVYEALPAGQQAIARDVLRNMTVTSRDGELARRPVTRDDLSAELPDAKPADIDAVLDAFAAGRLAVLDQGRAQISHDVLLRAWPRLRGWLEEDQASWILHGQLNDAAAAWHDSHEDLSFLYRGAQLATLQQAVAKWSASPARSPTLTGTQRDFLRASEAAAAQSTRRRRGGFALLALLTALAVVAAGFAFFQRATAVRQRDQAIYNQVIAEALQFAASDTSLAAQLTLAAYRIRPTQDLSSRLLNTENTPLSSPVAAGYGIVAVAFSSGGHTLAIGSGDGTIQLWNAADPAHPRPLGQPLSSGAGPVSSIAFSLGGHTLASGNGDGSIRLWNTADPAHPRPLGQPLISGTGTAVSVAFSSNGHTLASGNNDGTIRLWNTADPAHLRPLGQPLAIGADVAVAVAFSSNGHALAVGNNNGTIQLWNTADPAHLRPLGQPLASGTGAAVSVAFSPDGRTLASGSGDGAIRLWNIADPAHPRPLGQPLASGTGAAVSVAFSLDGHTLASGNNDGTIHMWNTADPAHPRPLGQPLAAAAAAESVAFSPDGHTLASGSNDGIFRLWRLPQTVLTGGTGPVKSVAVSPDGHTLASGNGDGTIQLWDTADPAHPRPLGRALTSGAENSVAFSPDGHTLASGSGDGAIRLWNIADPAHPRPLGQPLASGTGAAVSVAFSPDGHTLASGNGDSAIRLWNIADAADPRPLGQPFTGGTGPVWSLAFSRSRHMLASADGDGSLELWGVANPAHAYAYGPALLSNEWAVFAVAFSPDGHTLAVGYANNQILLLDAADPAHLRLLGQPLASGTGAAVSVAFSPDGRTLASGNNDGTIHMWNTADPAHPRPLGQSLTGSATVFAVAFSPHGHTLTSGSADGTTRIWNLNTQYAIKWICTTAGGLTPWQWNKYIPQLRYQPSCTH